MRDRPSLLLLLPSCRDADCGTHGEEVRAVEVHAAQHQRRAHVALIPAADSDGRGRHVGWSRGGVTCAGVAQARALAMMAANRTRPLLRRVAAVEWSGGPWRGLT